MKAQILNENQFKRLLKITEATSQANNKERNLLLLKLSFWTGMRVGEIRNLKLKHIINPNNTIKEKIFLSKEETKNTSFKNKKGREVFLSKKMRESIKEYVKIITNNFDAINPEKIIISSQKGGKFKYSNLVMLFKNLYRMAGYEDAKSHTGRRSFLSELSTKTSPFVLKKLAGHSNIQTTMLYVEVGENQLKDAVEMI